jgi:hypothetical protein
MRNKQTEIMRANEKANENWLKQKTVNRLILQRKNKESNRFELSLRGRKPDHELEYALNESYAQSR